MAHMSQEKKAKLAPAIKDVFKKYAIKGSIAVSNHMTLVVNIKSSPIDFIANFNETNSDHRDFRPASDYIDVNPYWYHEHFSGRASSGTTRRLDSSHKKPVHFATIISSLGCITTQQTQGLYLCRTRQDVKFPST